MVFEKLLIDYTVSWKPLPICISHKLRDFIESFKSLPRVGNERRIFLFFHLFPLTLPLGYSGSPGFNVLNLLHKFKLYDCLQTDLNDLNDNQAEYVMISTQKRTYLEFWGTNVTQR